MAKAKLNMLDAMNKWIEHSHKLIQPHEPHAEQPKKPPLKLTKKQRAVIREKFGGRCAYCGHELPATGWHADHAEPVERLSKFVRDERGFGKFIPTGEMMRPENDTIENMMPACRSCNIYKHSTDIETFRRMITRQLQNSINRTQCLRTGQRLGILKLDAAPIVFWFEKYGEMENGKSTQRSAGSRMSGQDTGHL
ncbi:HNH endonuclease [Xenorhabdus sp. TS4]|uniref:HNH endonuclease n=1 Tax=Xenorhabdus sp. TS4 TaxID=1873483 RepID=UPI0016575189|nr:HNH endonuclease signature motif containing protein [Xenorhabdus sp. TS4]MBC8949351.1 HNH endonuclease [Xenorhabdus sp. TS4]